MNTTLIAAASLVFVAGTALAGEGNGNPFPLDAGAVTVQVQAANDAGSQGYTRLQRPVTLLGNAEILPENGSETPVQTANSLPRGAEEGTVAYAQAQSTQRWMLAHLAPRTRLATR